MLGPIVGADEHGEELGDAAHGQPSLGQSVALRRDHRHRNARGPHALKGRARVGKGPHPRIVHGHVVLAVGRQQMLGQGLVAFREADHLIAQGRTDAGHERIIGQVASQYVVDGVAHGGENDVVGIDQRAVGIEQDAMNIVHRSLSAVRSMGLVAIVGSHCGTVEVTYSNGRIPSSRRFLSSRLCSARLGSDRSTMP